jgi:hypothetical protein
MRESEPLRKLARIKRDQIIASAWEEYHETLALIANIEQTLTAKRPRRKPPRSACITSALPRDTPFSLPDLMRAMEANGRVWNKKAASSLIDRLRARGIVRRLTRATPGKPATYVRVGSEASAGPLGDASLAEVLAMVLTKPMTVAELAERVVKAGYRTAQDRRTFDHSIRVELRRGAFRKVGRKWGRSPRAATSL